MARRVRAPTPGRAFASALARRPLEVRRIAGALRDLIRSAVPGATQSWIPGWQALAFRDTSDICFIRPLNTAVTLGFYRGDRVADPDRLLRGFAKRIRFVRIRTIGELEAAPLERLIANALTVSATASSGTAQG